MPDVEQLRKRREAEAQRREEALRAERRLRADKENERERKDHERRRVEEMARTKQEEKKRIEIEAAELKSRQLQAALGDKRQQRFIDEMLKNKQGPRPYTGAEEDT
jgi:hypothetical protein